MHGLEPGIEGGSGELWPTLPLGIEVGDGDGRPAVVAVQARALVALQLEQLQLVGAFGGGGSKMQSAMLIPQIKK